VSLWSTCQLICEPTALYLVPGLYYVLDVVRLEFGDLANS
jgi:hypothetical protein